MTILTDRLDLPKPEGSDPADGPGAVAGVADILDNAAIDLPPGIVAERPPPALRGRWYRATNGGLYYDKGDAWDTIVLDTDARLTNQRTPTDGSVTNAKVAAAAAIAYSKLNLALSIVNGDLADNSVSQSKMQDNSVGEPEIIDAAVRTAQIQDNAVTQAKMADNSVGSAEIVDGAVGNAEMADNAIGSAELQSNAVTKAKIADEAVGIPETGLGDAGLAQGAFLVKYAATEGTYDSADVLLFEGEEFDVSGWYNPANGRFTPQVPGYYRLTGQIRPNATWTSGQSYFLVLQKNGATYVYADQIQTVSSGSAALPPCTISIVVQANGTTDYFSLLYNTGGTPKTVAFVVNETFFCGEMVGRA